MCSRLSSEHHLQCHSLWAAARCGTVAMEAALSAMAAARATMAATAVRTVVVHVMVLVAVTVATQSVQVVRD